jgi:hypothetical protein
LRLIRAGKLDPLLGDLGRQLKRLRLDLEHGRADHGDIPGEQLYGAELNLAALAQHFALMRQRRHWHRAHQVDGHARDSHRHRRRNTLRGPYDQRRRRRAVLHARVPGAGGIRTGDDAVAVDAIDGVHQIDSNISVGRWMG